MTRGRENDSENWAGSSGRNTAGCSNSKRDDHVPVEILDMLDLDSDPASSDDDDMSDPVLEPKHQIFLSHSGHQKGLTELLCRELERWGYSPFFDVREDSLPKGKKFPELIFRAARQCRVAVLILSEEYFTKTKWPILELGAFVDAQEKSRKEKRPVVDILPVYLGLTREECRKDENVERWQKRWEEMENLEMVEKMKEMDELGRVETQAQYDAAREQRLVKWKDAMKVLGPSNGIEYKRSSREAGLIDRVVSAVRHLLPPPNMASDPGCQAKGRICKSLIEMISKTRASSNGARVVGVYGMGGMGKTTFCKEMCCELYKRFEGRVCHAELGRVSASELRKMVVQKLTDVNYCSLASADHSQVTKYITTLMAGEKVFLALDDVWPKSIGEAKVYVQKAQYGKGSIVMVTARSMDVLLLLGIRRDDCFKMPELEEEDARQLFLYHAAPDFQSKCNEDEKCIHRCVRECFFYSDGRSDGHFLPLAVKVLGKQMHGMRGNPSTWVESLLKVDKFDLDRKKEHPIFYILGRGYDSLRADDQLLFMDTVLCNPWSKMWGSPYEWWTLFEWLSIVHYGTTSEESTIRDRLQVLKARALLEDIGDGRHFGVHVHDLYREFVKFEASRGDLDARRVVWHVYPLELPMDLVKTPSGNCWSHVDRVGIQWHKRRSSFKWHHPFLYTLSVDGVKWRHFANVGVLELRIAVGDQVLDLQGLQCLRSLVVAIEGFMIIGLEKMRNLGWLELDGVRCGPCLEEIGCLTELKMLRMKGYCLHRDNFDDRRTCNPPSSNAGCLLNLEKCINLRELVVWCRCLKALPNLDRMKFLRTAEFFCPLATKGLGGLGSELCALQELRLKGCSSLYDCFHQLHEVVSLQRLEVHGLPMVEVFPDICMLTRLQSLTIEKLPKLVLVPGLEELTTLENLKLNLLPNLRELPLYKMVSLQKLDIGNLDQLEEFPDIRMLTRLQFLSIYHLPKVVVVRGLGELVALEELSLWRLPKLRELPKMHLLTKLQWISLEEIDEALVEQFMEQPQLLGMVPLDLGHSKIRWYRNPGTDNS